MFSVSNRSPRLQCSLLPALSRVAQSARI